MLAITCLGCARPLELDNSHVGPAAAVALRTPLEALCLDCVERRELTVRLGGVPYVLVDGREFRQVIPDAAFVRSLHPLSAAIYFRDE